MDSITVGATAVVLSGLIYFAGVRRGKELQRRSEHHAEELRDADWAREDANRVADECKQRVEEVVRQARWLLTPDGGSYGVHCETLQAAGIRALSDSEIRRAMTAIGECTPISIPESEWAQLEKFDLKKVFNACYRKIDLSGGPPTLIRVAEGLRSEGVDVGRAGS